MNADPCLVVDRVSETATTPAVRVRGLEYSYPDGKDALRGVDLAVVPVNRSHWLAPTGRGRARYYCT